MKPGRCSTRQAQTANQNRSSWKLGQTQQNKTRHHRVRRFNCIPYNKGCLAYDKDNKGYFGKFLKCWDLCAQYVLKLISICFFFLIPGISIQEFLFWVVVLVIVYDLRTNENHSIESKNITPNKGTAPRNIERNTWLQIFQRNPNIIQAL